LSGGDVISARHLHKERFNFRPTHKVVLVTNHRPRVHGTDYAMWRRLRVVPFEVTIPPDRQDPALRRRFVEEDGAAVLAWLVAGAVEWYETGLGDAAAVTTATEAYKTSQDTLGAWLAERTIVVERRRTKLGELFDDWRAWAERAGERPGRLQAFRADLEERGLALERHQDRTEVVGIALLTGAGQGSTGNFPIATSTLTLRTSPDEPSRDMGEDEL
ncbi:MAG TPA: phage/plasmid primase, P4 family, partial [Acidimicrobiales bacterium]|nr:phage/plasmid primase, P4 family [Acidimicrobiales bacterium]